MTPGRPLRVRGRSGPDRPMGRGTEPRLRAKRVVLRTMMESDLPSILRWNQDPRVLHYWDGGRTEPWSQAKLTSVYRKIGRGARMFVIELRGRVVGEGWVQRMNLPEPVRAYPGEELRRIDLALGFPELWGRGLGREAADLLLALAFRADGADRVFACDVADDNPRSLRMFRALGFRRWTAPGREPPTRSGRYLMITRRGWSARRRRGRSGSARANRR